jgi:aminoglycoside phosphotransferase (APT) family kinase protein
MGWDDSCARRAAVAMCKRAGLPEIVGELLRFGSNAVFALGQAYVLRITPPGTSRIDVQREIDLACEFARLDVPAIHLAELAARQPLGAHNCLGTVWERLEEPDRNLIYQPFGQLLHVFHQHTARLLVPLEPWQPLASANRRLAQLRGHYPPADMTMLTDCAERIAAELDHIAPTVPPGVIHGQAEVGNVLLRAGDPVFIDFERVAIGPREWDLIDTAVTVTRFGLPEHHYRDFADAYGFDVRAWSSYQTYRALWELRAITWLMRHGRHRPEVSREIEVRLQSWRDGNPNTRWSSVLERNRATNH